MILIEKSIQDKERFVNIQLVNRFCTEKAAGFASCRN